MTAKGACEVLECSGQKLWRIERGLTAMRALDVKVMCEVYGADERTTEALMALAKSTKERGWWHAYGKTVPAWFELYVGLEEAVSGLRIFQPQLIPGLLQTSAYIREVIRAADPKLPEEEIERRVQARLHRQKLLSRRAPVPPRLDVIITEAVLSGMPEDVTDARDQFRRLAAAAPASNTVKAMPRSCRCAAAANPTGPAPITTTGSAVPLRGLRRRTGCVIAAGSQRGGVSAGVPQHAPAAVMLSFIAFSLWSWEEAG